MKSIFLLLACLYYANVAAQSRVQKAEKKATVIAGEFCKALKEITEIASQNKLATLKQDKFKSVYIKSEKIYNSSKKITTALENLIVDDTLSSTLQFIALLKNYVSDAVAAKADFMVMVKKIEDCLGTKAFVPSAEELEVFIHHKKCRVTISTYLHFRLNQWLCTVTIENEH